MGPWISDSGPPHFCRWNLVIIIILILNISIRILIIITIMIKLWSPQNGAESGALQSRCLVRFVFNGGAVAEVTK